MSWDFSAEPESAQKLEWMRAFVREEIIPLEVATDHVPTRTEDAKRNVAHLLEEAS
ncbi:hypothetical protein [Brevibacterium jeotgali]|uniref:Acyl-CoA dehydrogenase n=1 Tax=Brevibacterium jeotgali TaxID=1262550 RepID=A0A2H1L7T7_9MICO|nr:hypothetical protein [Brevibacterium jeotgali]TWB99050.1 hypothetical protein FB108_2964 [Brevibacterium jeotgali]SMY12443.1 hypothetical protein BJEO58_02037 [Brevibacterium jeotgali]